MTKMATRYALSFRAIAALLVALPPLLWYFPDLESFGCHGDHNPFTYVFNGPIQESEFQVSVSPFTSAESQAMDTVRRGGGRAIDGAAAAGHPSSARPAAPSSAAPTPSHSLQRNWILIFKRLLTPIVIMILVLTKWQRIPCHCKYCK